jgi:hypothetical protein
MRPDKRVYSRVGNPLLARYLTDMIRIRAWWVLILHYLVTLGLIVLFWPSTISVPFPHPEILVKLGGAYCFLIGTIVVPLVSPILFPRIDEDDESFGTLPITRTAIFDTRMIATLVVSSLTLFPLVPIFIYFSYAAGGRFDPLYLFPFFQGVATSAWVFLLMEIAEGSGDRFGREARRLAIVAAFILLHVGLVGLLAQLSPSTLQRANLLKIIIDLNPFSQLYIFMQGPDARRLLVNTYSLTLIDYRIYLFIVHMVFFGLVWVFHRAIRSSRESTSHDRADQTWSYS